MKKVFGYIFLVIGGFLGISLVMQLPKNIEKFKATSKTFEGNDSAYIAGAITGMVIIVLVAFFLIRLGLKWIKKSNEEQSNLPE